MTVTPTKGGALFREEWTKNSKITRNKLLSSVIGCIWSVNTFLVSYECTLCQNGFGVGVIILCGRRQTRRVTRRGRERDTRDELNLLVSVFIINIILLKCIAVSFIPSWPIKSQLQIELFITRGRLFHFAVIAIIYFFLNFTFIFCNQHHYLWTSTTDLDEWYGDRNAAAPAKKNKVSISYLLYLKYYYFYIMGQRMTKIN